MLVFEWEGFGLESFRNYTSLSLYTRTHNGDVFRVLGTRYDINPLISNIGDDIVDMPDIDDIDEENDWPLLIFKF